MPLPTVTLQLPPQAVEGILQGLNQLPRGAVNDLFNEVARQYQEQMNPTPDPAPAEPAESAKPAE